jgi:hypothetical protein
VILTILILLVVLWLLGYLAIPNLVIPDVPLFAINGHIVTLIELAILLVILAALGVLPSPLRQIGVALVVLWALATLGIIAVAGLSSILVIAIIVGLIAALLSAPRRMEAI